VADASEPPRLTGRLLVATPGLIDPNFFRTVVLIVEHNEEGAAGLVLNRPSETDLRGSELGEWGDLAADPALVFVGGPVSPAAAVCLARAGPGEPPQGWQRVVDGLGVVDLSVGIDDVGPRIDRLRMFAGYAGWGAGQLEDELGSGSWYVVDADAEDCLSSEPGGLWRFVLKRQGGRLAVVSNFPVDPSLN
jgi:putative transcriptional regulator